MGYGIEYGGSVKEEDWKILAFGLAIAFWAMTALAACQVGENYGFMEGTGYSLVKK